MTRLVRRSLRPVRLVLAAAAVALLAVLFSTTAAAGSTAAPLPPGSMALAVDAPPAVAGVTPPADGSICYYGACYNYVAGRQYAWYATGASVDLWRARPSLDPNDPNAHSLQELAVQSSDELQIVEVGWTVDRSLNGDDAPHLFVYHWVDGNTSCYNGCGFVSTSTKVVPGEKMPSGGYSNFQINHVGDEWQISLDGTMFGYFPDSLWGNSTFTQPLLIQAFGEVASTSTPTCNQMGTGKFAESPASSSMRNFTLLGPTVSPTNLFAPGYELVTNPQWYDAGNLQPTGYSLGGPGSGRCAK
jgi:hypothetical protein